MSPSPSGSAQLQSIMQDVPVGICILRGPEFVVEIANATYLQIVDRKEEEFVGKSLFVGLPEVKSAVEQLLNDVYHKGIPYHGHEFPVTLNRYGKSELAYFNFVYQPSYNAAGTIDGVVVVANEVTPNVTARQKLAESERKFREIVMQSPIAMTIFLGEDLVIDIANQKLLDTFWRTTADKVLGRKLLDAFPELNDQKFPELLHKVFREGVPHAESEAAVYIEGPEAKGRKFYVDFVYEPLFDSDKKVFGIVVTVTDVTERVEYRKRVEEAEEKMRIAIESADLGTYEVDLATGEATMSERLLKIFGFDGPASRQDVTSRFHPDDLPIRTKAHEDAIKTGRLFYEMRTLVPGKKIGWIRAEGAVIRDKEGKPLSLIGVVQEITDEKNFADELERQVQLRTEQLQAANEEIAATNEELAQSNDKLISANFELEQFNYAASHDLQEPVRKIQTFISYLTTEGANSSADRRADYLNKVMTAAERMKNIIDDLLLYARHSRTEKQLVTTNLNEVMEAVTSELDLMIEQRGATLEVGPLPTIQAVPSQMHQLFRNLLSNSLKFVKPGVKPVIKVHAETAGDERSHITFEDNGIGFKQEFGDYIFKLFKRLHSKSEYDGTGIGLSLCKKIVENHSGDIYATSVPGEGTTMHVILPTNLTE